MSKCFLSEFPAFPQTCGPAIRIPVQRSFIDAKSLYLEGQFTNHLGADKNIADVDKKWPNEHLFAPVLRAV